MNIKQVSTYFLLLLSMMIACPSCIDELDYEDYAIPEGSGDLVAQVTFPDLVSTALGDSRSSGTAIETVKDIFVGLYNPDGELMESAYFEQGQWNDVSDKPADGIESVDGSDMSWAYGDERKTPRAEFTIKEVPFGRYQIYVAANVGDLAKSAKDAIQTVAGLKSISYDWLPNDINGNNQMFGYFTDMDKQTSTGYDAPLIKFTPTNTAVHAWIRRLASKVTIAYDPHGLNDNVTIYIHSVTIRDIPKSCFLGQQNPQWNASDVQGVHPLELLNRKTVDGGNGSLVDNSYFNYDRKGITTGDVDLTNPLRGIKLQNGYVGQAAVKEGSVIQGSNHKFDAQALYFYENMQGDYKNIARFDKFQQERGKDDGVGENVTSGTYGDDKVTPLNDYKDRVPYGTYIEVEGYYDSKNPNNVSSGPIKYRFMLGKNTTFNYDAQRNHHYKLTLGFNGWANQPDWHIEYDEPDPVFFLPETWYMSYLYNQRSMLPIKVASNCYKIEIEITQNHWCPYEESTYTGPDNWPPAENTTIWPEGGKETTGENYNFIWAEQVVKGNGGPALNGWTTPQLGFLTLLVEGNVPEDIPTSIFGKDMAKDYRFSDGDDAVTAAGEIFEKRKVRVLGGDTQSLNLKERPDGRLETNEIVCSDANNNYFIQPVEDNNGIQDPSQKTILVPLWTMPKDIIIGSGFSGNNPYEEFPRVANIHVKAYFTGLDQPKEGDCRVIQPKRITNPKGVWRKSGTSGPFRVTLMEQGGLNAHSDFTEMVSDGTWKAYIVNPTNFIKLSSASADSEVKDGVVYGNTGSFVDFNIDFNGSDGVAVINVEYNGEMSVHKILVREGYDKPVTMGDNRWSTYALYGATAIDGKTNEFDVVLTKNPLAFGSYVRRERVSDPILVSNNGRTDYDYFGPMDPPGNWNLWLYEEKPPSDPLKRRRLTWKNIGSNIYIDGIPYNYNGTSATSGTSLGVNGQDAVKYACSVLGSRSMGKFHTNEYVYRVPTLQDYKQLADECQYAFGILYGDAASGTAKKWDMATGFHDDDNDDDTDESKKGVRGVIVYNPETAEQIFFSVGRFGMGRRRQYNTNGDTYWGTLWYSDMNSVMPMTGNNWYRPIAYNVKIDPGAVYWIDKLVKTGELDNNFPNEDCFGWDINYMNLDFNNFSHNCVLDALPIKFVIESDKTNN